MHIRNYSEVETEEAVLERESSTAIETEEGILRRDHGNEVLVPNAKEPQSITTTKSCPADQNEQDQVISPMYTKTRSGRISKPPDRFS